PAHFGVDARSDHWPGSLFYAPQSTSFGQSRARRDVYLVFIEAGYGALPIPRSVALASSLSFALIAPIAYIASRTSFLRRKARSRFRIGESRDGADIRPLIIAASAIVSSAGTFPKIRIDADR